MTAFEIQDADGQERRLILRSYGPHHADRDLQPEYHTLFFVHAQGLPAPKPLLLDDSLQLLNEPYIVMKYTQGEMIFPKTGQLPYVRQMAEQLARIHSVDLAELNQTLFHQQKKCHEGDKGLVHHDLKPLLRQIESRLNQPPAHSLNSPALLHGDFWPGNTLWHDGRLVSIIDWENAHIGDPLIDLARSRSEISWIFGRKALDIFTKHYQELMAIDYTHLPYWDSCAALRQLCFFGKNIPAIADYFIPYSRTDITERSMKRDITTFVNQSMNH